MACLRDSLIASRSLQDSESCNKDGNPMLLSVRCNSNSSLDSNHCIGSHCKVKQKDMISSDYQSVSADINSSLNNGCKVVASKLMEKTARLRDSLNTYCGLLHVRKFPIESVSPLSPGARKYPVSPNGSGMRKECCIHSRLDSPGQRTAVDFSRMSSYDSGCECLESTLTSFVEDSSSGDLSPLNTEQLKGSSGDLPVLNMELIQAFDLKDHSGFDHVHNEQDSPFLNEEPISCNASLLFKNIDGCQLNSPCSNKSRFYEVICRYCRQRWDRVLNGSGLLLAPFRLENQLPEFLLVAFCWNPNVHGTLTPICDFGIYSDAPSFLHKELVPNRTLLCACHKLAAFSCSSNSTSCSSEPFACDELELEKCTGKGKLSPDCKIQHNAIYAAAATACMPAAAAFTAYATAAVNSAAIYSTMAAQVPISAAAVSAVSNAVAVTTATPNVQATADIAANVNAATDSDSLAAVLEPAETNTATTADLAAVSVPDNFASVASTYSDSFAAADCSDQVHCCNNDCDEYNNSVCSSKNGDRKLHTVENETNCNHSDSDDSVVYDDSDDYDYTANGNDNSDSESSENYSEHESDDENTSESDEADEIDGIIFHAETPPIDFKGTTAYHKPCPSGAKTKSCHTTKSSHCNGERSSDTLSVNSAHVIKSSHCNGERSSDTSFVNSAQAGEKTAQKELDKVSRKSGNDSDKSNKYSGTISLEFNQESNKGNSESEMASWRSKKISGESDKVSKELKKDNEESRKMIGENMIQTGTPEHQRKSFFIYPDDSESSSEYSESDNNDDTTDDESEIDDNDWDSPAATTSFSIDEELSGLCLPGLYMAPPSGGSPSSSSPIAPSPTRAFDLQLSSEAGVSIPVINYDDDDIIFTSEEEGDGEETEEERLEAEKRLERLKEINTRWRKMYPSESSGGVEVEVDGGRVEPESKMVCFSDGEHVVCCIPMLCEAEEWLDDYRKARIGEWKNMAADRLRFNRRIKIVESEIGWVFSSEHRNKVYRKISKS